MQHIFLVMEHDIHKCLTETNHRMLRMDEQIIRRQISGFCHGRDE